MGGFRGWRWPIGLWGTTMIVVPLSPAVTWSAAGFLSLPTHRPLARRRPPAMSSGGRSSPWPSPSPPPPSRARSGVASTGGRRTPTPRGVPPRPRRRAPGTLLLSTSSTSSSDGTDNNNVIRRDVVIIGGGLAGLSAALELSTSPHDRHVTLLDRQDLDLSSSSNDGGSSRAEASFAAAGMLAPQSERLPPGPLLDLCLQSRGAYSNFVAKVEDLARGSGREGRKFLWKNGDGGDGGDDGVEGGGMREWEVGFRASGGFIAPAFAGDSVATWAPPEGSGTARWLDDVQVRELEPQLHPDVVGGWWFPEDASVDARRLTCGLRAACSAAGVQMNFGEDYGVTSLELDDGRCTGVRLNDGRIFSADAVIVANGSWMRDLLPVPIVPHKGQSFSLRMPRGGGGDPTSSPFLSRVLFSQDTYVVPKADGRIIVGATVEPGSFDPSVTPAGMVHCMTAAMQLVPALADLPLEETWSGLRPTTPDKAPILGRTDWNNLFLAGGYWRNGVLLAPKTGQLLADLVDGTLSDRDEELLNAFAWDRFTSPGGGKKLAVASRYAASLHPTQHRSKGFGVSAAVGTELGFYSGAGAAADERRRDRDALFGKDSGSFEDSLERAAQMGVSDAASFSFDDDEDGDRSERRTGYDTPSTDAESEESAAAIEVDSSAWLGTSDSDGQDTSGGLDASGARHTVYASSNSYEGYADAYTVGSSEEVPERTVVLSESAIAEDGDMGALYEKIRKNKAEASSDVEMDDSSAPERPDFPFRIYHIDKETGQERLVPPYTTPEDFEKMVAAEKAGRTQGSEKNATTPSDGGVRHPEEEGSASEPDETTFDGYVEIQQANGASSRKDELKAMRRARMSNRVSVSDIDESRIGAQRAEEDLSLS